MPMVKKPRILRAKVVPVQFEGAPSRVAFISRDMADDVDALLWNKSPGLVKWWRPSTGYQNDPV